MTEIVDVRKVVAKMRLLASNAENRPFIAKDKGCLRGLLAFLDNASDDVVFTALEALVFLCMHQPNVAVLQALDSLPEKAAALCGSSGRGRDIQNIAAQLHAVLQSGTAPAAPAPALAVRSPMKDRTNQQQSLLASPAKSPSVRTPAKCTVSTMCLRIEGVATENDRSVIERSIVSLKGKRVPPQPSRARAHLRQASSAWPSTAAAVPVREASAAFARRLERVCHTMCCCSTSALSAASGRVWKRR